MKPPWQFLLGIFIGAAACLLLVAKDAPRTYETTLPLAVRSGATTLMHLGAGQRVVAIGSSMFQTDIAWFGCIPMNFGEGSEASSVLRETAALPTANTLLHVVREALP